MSIHMQGYRLWAVVVRPEGAAVCPVIGWERYEGRTRAVLAMAGRGVAVLESEQFVSYYDTWAEAEANKDADVLATHLTTEDTPSTSTPGDTPGDTPEVTPGSGPGVGTPTCWCLNRLDYPHPHAPTGHGKRNCPAQPYPSAP